MFSTHVNMYHPFQSSSLGLLVKNNSNLENVNGLFFEDIVLSHQPLPDPNLGIFAFFLRLISVCIGIVVQVKVWHLIKNEKSLTTEVVKVYIVALIVMHPHFLMFVTIIDFIHPINQVVGQWFCTLNTFILYFCFIIIAFNSFIVSLMRYLFIVHEEKVKKFGKQNVKRFFLVLSMLIPLLMNLWRTVDPPAKDPMSWVNKCNGNHHKVYLMKVTSSHLAGEGMCSTMKYDEGDYYQMFIAFLVKLSCISRVVIVFIMGLNFTEGFIYFKIFRHMMR